MRTTFALPELLIEEARKASGKPTKTATIIYALEEVVRRKRLEGLKAMFGTMDVRVDLDKVRGRRKARSRSLAGPDVDRTSQLLSGKATAPRSGAKQHSERARRSPNRPGSSRASEAQPRS